MGNIFLIWLKRDKFIFGVIISLITSIGIIITLINYADIIKKDIIYLPLTAGLFIVLFTWYVEIMRKNDR